MRDVTIKTAVPEYQPVDPTRTAAITYKTHDKGLMSRHPQANDIKGFLLEERTCPCVVAQVSMQARSGSFTCGNQS